MLLIPGGVLEEYVSPSGVCGARFIFIYNPFSQGSDPDQRGSGSDIVNVLRSQELFHPEPMYLGECEKPRWPGPEHTLLPCPHPC